MTTVTMRLSSGRRKYQPNGSQSSPSAGKPPREMHERNEDGTGTHEHMAGPQIRASPSTGSSIIPELKRKQATTEGI